MTRLGGFMTLTRLSKAEEAVNEGLQGQAGF
jgi:hypothetical protein